MNRRPQPRKNKGTSSGFLSPPATINWQIFQNWLLKNYEARTARLRFNYARRFHQHLLDGNLSFIHSLSDGKRGHVLRALSALAKFLGAYDDFKALVRNYGVKWTGKRSEDLIIKRLVKATNCNELAEWVKDVKKALPKLSCFIDFMLVSGLRFEEAIQAWNLIIDLAKQGRLSEYYNAENQALEHFRFRELFIRRTKKAFISFIPESLVRKIASCDKVSRDSINCKLKRKGIKAKFSDLREYHASYLTKYLRQPEIDFLHGRIGVSVFMQNYFNPALISDLKERTFKAISEILEKISNPLLF